MPHPSPSHTLSSQLLSVLPEKRAEGGEPMPAALPRPVTPSGTQLGEQTGEAGGTSWTHTDEPPSA